MSFAHAVVWLDHQNAQVLQFDAEHVKAEKVKAHSHYTRQHGSSVRTEHEFFGEVCDSLAGIAEVLVTGPHIAQADFRHYVDKHRPAVGKLIVGYETVDHPSVSESITFARKYFLRHDRMAGRPTPTSGL